MSEKSENPLIVPQIKQTSAKKPFWKQRFPSIYIILNHPQARIGVVIILLFILMGVFAPLIAPGNPSEYLGMINQPPSKEHILGVDPLGRMSSAYWYGARASL